MKKYVLLYDSGMGGQYVLNVFKSKFKHTHFLLYADTLHAPFGNKSKQELEKILFTALFEMTKKYPIFRIIIACNTMSSMFKNQIKRIYSNTIFIEPQINKKILSKPTLVLATQNTIKYSAKLKKYKRHPNYYEVSFKSLAKKIDSCQGDFDSLLPYIKRKLFPYNFVQNIVLGCTHYNWIKPQIEQCFTHKITFYESSQKQAKKLNKKSPLL